jgi:Fe-Mn family superoxide dismutase
MKTLSFTVLFIFVVALLSCNSNSAESTIQNTDKEKTVKMGNPADVQAEPGAFKMIPLPYAYNALEPFIDSQTMEIHFSKHHLAYTNNLNKTIAGTDMENKSIEEILKNLDGENKAVRNNGGGYYNHNFFWEIMGPGKGGQPEGKLAEAITKDFGSFDNFKTAFSKAAASQFGSGWAWLYVDEKGKLNIASTPNQDNLLMKSSGIKGTAILNIDVWEHAYYLKYQNKRADYIEAFFNVINWDKVTEKYNLAVK